MYSIAYKHHIIAYEEFKYEHNGELKDFIDQKKYSEILDAIDYSCVLVLGWDGTMLWAIHEFFHLHYVFVGINFWTVGFLLNDKKHISSNLVFQSYPILELHLQTKEGNQSFFSFNEVDVRAWDGRIVTLEISLEEEKYISIAWDGIVFSTPAGSTGYNTSLWGPIIPHDVPVFVLTAKAPFRPRGQTPILISSHKRVFIRNIGRKNKLEIYSDAKPLYSGVWEDIVLEIRTSPVCVRMGIFESYQEEWTHKVLWEQWFLKK